MTAPVEAPAALQHAVLAAAAGGGRPATGSAVAGVGTPASAAAAAAFDGLAPAYDATFSTGAIGTLLRQAVWRRLDACFAPGDRVLEVGCGTGEDAVHLARRGVRVLATDASAGMLEVARTKIDAAGLAGAVELRRLDIEQLTASNTGAATCGPPPFGSTATGTAAAASWDPHASGPPAAAPDALAPIPSPPSSGGSADALTVAYEATGATGPTAAGTAGAGNAYAVGIAGGASACTVGTASGSACIAGAPFDGALSNFGALNCVADLRGAAAGLARCLRPGAVAVLCLMGPWVPWEWLWFLGHGEPARAFRRLRPGGAAWRGTTIRYPSIRGARRALAPAFRLRRAAALGALLPPTYAERWAARHPRLLRRLDLWERRTETWPPLPWLADHYLLELERT